MWENVVFSLFCVLIDIFKHGGRFDVFSQENGLVFGNRLFIYGVNCGITDHPQLLITTCTCAGSI